MKHLTPAQTRFNIHKWLNFKQFNCFTWYWRHILDAISIPLFRNPVVFSSSSSLLLSSSLSLLSLPSPLSLSLLLLLLSVSSYHYHWTATVAFSWLFYIYLCCLSACESVCQHSCMSFRNSVYVCGVAVGLWRVLLHDYGKMMKAFSSTLFGDFGHESEFCTL